ncbi:MAG: mechanosensitive ion channel family protein, partial [bacterium]|nr:mechanosensitive ion channel family protein [bacterium]
RIKTTKLTYALHDVAVENKGFVFAIDEESQNVIFYTNSNYVNEPADKLGVTDAIYVDGYTGYQTVAGVKCFVSGIKYENQYIYVAVPVRNIGSGIFVVTVIVTAISFLLMLVLMGSLFIRRRVDDIQGEEPDDQEPKEETQEFKAEPRGMIDVQLGEKPRRVQSIVGRYDNQNKIRWNERSPEEKITRIIYIVMLILACAFVVFIYLQRGTYNRNSIFSYIINRKWEKKPNIFSYTYIAIVMIEVIVITSVLRKLIKTVSSNMGVRAETIGRLVCSFAKYISIIGAIFYCMSFIGIDSKALFASAGIMGIVLGLGAQSLISDVLAGIFIVFEGEFRVGDIITIGTWRGTVLEIGIRSTKVEDASQNIKIFNNSTVKEVVNMTKKYSQAYCDLGIEYDESLEHVESVLKKELPLMKERLEHIVAGPYYKGVVGLNDSSVTLRILAQCEEKNRIQLTRDLTRELKLMCDRYNISIPFPQVVVNQPREHKKVTKREKSMAEEFVKEQKEDSKGISVDN